VLGGSHFFKNHWFWVFMPLCENRVVSFFILNRGLTRIVWSIRFFPRKKNLVLKLGGSQQFENSWFFGRSQARSQKFQYSFWEKKIHYYFWQKIDFEYISVVYKSIISSISKSSFKLFYLLFYVCIYPNEFQKVKRGFTTNSTIIGSIFIYKS
jgi:hypothetical protein